MDTRVFNEVIRERGWVIVPALLPRRLVRQINAELVPAIATCGLMRAKYGVETATEGIAHHILSMGGVFLEFIDMLPLRSELEDCLGGQIIINSFGGFTHKPNSATYAGAIHRDIRSHFGDTPLMLNMLVMLDEFTANNGATHLLDGSHHVAEKPDKERFFSQASRAQGPAGSVLVFHSQLWHSSGENKSDAERRALTLTFTRPFYKQQMDYPRLVGYDKLASLSENQRQLIGYNSRTPASYDEWYQPPEKRMYKQGQE
jgi:ectoine hydroxylase-related dioxygenase (phytanoyl-CoA dioxygenase family)